MSSFDVWWQIYPRKVGKLDAQKAYEKAIKKVPEHVIRAATLRHADECKGKEEQFIPHPATWLNAGRWDDQKMPVKSMQTAGAPRQFPPERRSPERPRSLSWANVFIPSGHNLYVSMCERAEMFQTDAREFIHTASGIWVSRLWLHEDMACALRRLPENAEQAAE